MKSSKASEVAQNPVSPYQSGSSSRIDIKTRSSRGKKLLQLGTNVPSGIEGNKVTDHKTATRISLASKLSIM
jgi:hypothetical protein